LLTCLAAIHTATHAATHTATRTATILYQSELTSADLIVIMDNANLKQVQVCVLQRVLQRVMQCVL